LVRAAARASDRFLLWSTQIARIAGEVAGLRAL
jgi:hypothetical protein